jgi:hypothetical protein
MIGSSRVARTYVTLAIGFLLVRPVATQPSRQVPEYAFGTVTIAVPAPAGYTEVLATNPEIRETFGQLLTGTGGGPLAFYLPTGAARGVQGLLEGESWAMLTTPADLREVTIEGRDCLSIATRLRTSDSADLWQRRRSRSTESSCPSPRPMS